jgi:hypothetical protein
MRYSTKVDLTQVRRYSGEVQKKYVPAAAGIALKRVGNTARKEAAVTIRERLAIKASVAKGALTMKRVGSTRVLIIASGDPIPLRDYGARMTRRGATFRVARAGKRKVYRRQGRAGFILPSKGGHVFARIEADPPGPQKARIAVAYGPSIPQYFVTKVVINVMERVARERWPVEFSAALRGVLIRRTGVDVGADLAGLG